MADLGLITKFIYLHSQTPSGKFHFREQIQILKVIA
jgi:hypothetical protein